MSKVPLNINSMNIYFNSSPANGQNIVQLLSQSAKKWCVGRESFDCLVHELDGPIEMAVCKSIH